MQQGRARFVLAMRAGAAGGARRRYCTPAPDVAPLPKFRQKQQRLLHTAEAEYVVAAGQITGQARVPDSEEGIGSFAKVFPKAAAVLPVKAARVLDRVTVHLLPKGCLDGSVSPTYFRYVSWYTTGAVIGSATMVFSTQSLLYAAGLGAGALPVAAALSWVLKDGLGQLGGVLFCSVVNRNFDADPKRWRFVAGLVLDLAAVIEALTPFCPVLFLPLAALANGLKNVSFLSASATRASFHAAFAQKGNLADITAKAGAQTTAAATLGTSAAVAVSAAVGANHLHILYCVLATTSAHMLCLYKSIKSIALPTLNLQRLELLVTGFLDGNGVQTPGEIGKREVIIGPNGDHLLKGYKPIVTIGAALPSFVSKTGVSLERVAADLSEKKYCLAGTDLVLSGDAGHETVLEAVFLGVRASRGAGEVAQFADFYSALPAAGWDTVHLSLEERDSRVRLVPPSAASA